MNTTKPPKRDFKWRNAVSLTTSWMFLVMGITGLILYIVPQGRIAYWVDWQLLGLTKTNWGDIHIVASIFFLVAGGWHLYFNWKIFVNHLQVKLGSSKKLSKELVITIIFAVLMVAGALFHIPPFSYLIDLNDTIKSSWIESEDYEPPFGHAELLSLERLSKKTNIPLKEAVKALKEAKIKLTSPKETLEEIAKNNNVSPKDIFALIKHLQKPLFPQQKTSEKLTTDDVFERFEGSGIGKMTVKEACDIAGDELSRCLGRLEKSGVDAQSDDNMKKIADQVSMRPIKVLQIMLVD